LGLLSLSFASVSQSSAFRYHYQATIIFMASCSQILDILKSLLILD
jgi:hypothetical protein